MIATGDEIVDVGAAVGFVLLATVMSVGAGLVVLVKPRPRAKRDGDELVLAVAPWRRATGVLLFPTFGTIFLLTVPLPHAGAVWTVLVLMTAFAALLHWGGSIRMRVSPRGFWRDRQRRRGEPQPWSGVVRVEVQLRGVRVQTRDGRWHGFSGLADGYPECADVLRRYLPSDALDRTPGARDLLAYQASPVEPTGEPSERSTRTYRSGSPF